MVTKGLKLETQYTIVILEIDLHSERTALTLTPIAKMAV